MKTKPTPSNRRKETFFYGTQIVLIKKKIEGIAFLGFGCERKLLPQKGYTKQTRQKKQRESIFRAKIYYPNLCGAVKRNSIVLCLCKCKLKINIRYLFCCVPTLLAGLVHRVRLSNKNRTSTQQTKHNNRISEQKSNREKWPIIWEYRKQS